MSRLLDILRDSGMPIDMARDFLEGIDIDAAYKEIQDKTSELSRAQRDRVVARWKINQEFKANGIEDVPCYYIDEYIVFDDTWNRVFTSYDPKLTRWSWKKAQERYIEEGKKLERIRTNMPAEELLIEDPPNLVMEGGEYRGFTVKRVTPEEAGEPYLFIKLGDHILHQECNPVTDKQVREMIDTVAEKVKGSEGVTKNEVSDAKVS